MSNRRKSAHLERIMASLTRATKVSDVTRASLNQHASSGREQAWKRFVDEDVTLRVPRDLARRLARYAQKLSSEQPHQDVAATNVAYSLLSWALEQKELAHPRATTVEALISYANQVHPTFEVLWMRLQDLQSFDPRYLLGELAELERLHADLTRLCSSLRVAKGCERGS